MCRRLLSIIVFFISAAYWTRKLVRGQEVEVGGGGESCLHDWMNIDGKCYYFDLRNTSTVFGARSICAARKARLPVFESVLEYNRFNETISKTHPNMTVPLGLQLLGEHWTWMSDGELSEDIYWQTGSKAPHEDPKKRCVARTDREWKPVACNETFVITPVCQIGMTSVSLTEIPCAPLYRFGFGWQHLLTTNAAEASDRGFYLNQTSLLGETLYVATIYIPDVTQPFYEVEDPKATRTSMVNTEEDVQRLVGQHGFQIRGIIGYTLTSPGFVDATKRYLSWSSDPGDTVVTDETEHTKYMLNWNWKAKPDLYFYNRTLGVGRCAIERNCTLTEWEPWGNCSNWCGNATRSRNRTILLHALGNGHCEHTEEEEYCTENEPCPTVQFVDLPVEIVDALEGIGALDSITDQQSVVASIINAVIPAVFAAEPGNIHEVGHQLNDTIEFCMYDDQTCDEEKLFTTRLNPFYGNCFTFNPYEGALNVTRSGPQGGLRLLMRLQQHEYYPCTQTAGFKVYMHPPTEYPFVETYGYNIAPGLLTSMAISMAKLEKKDTPQNPCTDDWRNPAHPGISYYYNGTYNPEGCTKSCLQDYVIKQCNCADPRYARPGNVSFCSDVEETGVPEEKRNYANYTSVRTLCPDFYQNTSCKRDYLKEANCKCISQCDRVYFDAVINTALLLSNQHMQEVACEEVNYTKGCAEHATVHFALLEIYYERLQSVTFHEEEATTIWELLQDISNMLQNINGFDFFAVFEVGFLIAEIINVTCFGKRKRKLQKSRVPFVRLLADDTTMTDFLFFLFTFCGSLMLVAFLYSSKVLEIRW